MFGIHNGRILGKQMNSWGGEREEEWLGGLRGGADVEEGRGDGEVKRWGRFRREGLWG